MGESLSGKVMEILPLSELLISFDGELQRVVNHTGQNFKPGDKVLLLVRALQPLRLQLMPSLAEQRRRRILDRSV
jgi:hypothetical protein